MVLLCGAVDITCGWCYCMMWLDGVVVVGVRVWCGCGRLLFLYVIDVCCYACSVYCMLLLYVVVVVVGIVCCCGGCCYCCCGYMMWLLVVCVLFL